MTPVIGIVGGGPRGLSALESLCAQHARASDIGFPHIDLFEPLSRPGAGQVYVPEQSTHNWLNVPERLIDLPARPSNIINGSKLPGFPSYWDYVGFEHGQWEAENPDRYPTRGELGKYLAERFDTLAQAMTQHQLLTWHRSQVTSVQPVNAMWQITVAGGNTFTVNDLAIAAGHQPTQADDQMAQWSDFADGAVDVHCVSDPFPADPFQALLDSSTVHSVALRGFGLSMIDVMKNLTEGMGGHYKPDPDREHGLIYQPSGSEPKQIVPFSLDGLPMGPKPVSLAVDQRYALPSSAIEKLSNTLEYFLKDSPEQPLLPVLIEAMAELSVQAFKSLNENARAHSATQSQLVALVIAFLTDAKHDTHELIDRDLPVHEALEGYLAMAYGEQPASLDYCIGQVWRHAQPTLYASLSYELTSREDIADIVALDERMKRYAFGPPPASLERILALCKAGIVSLDYVDNPAIETIAKKGWSLRTDDSETTVQMMIDTVLDSTTVVDVNSQLFDNLKDQHLIEPSHPGLGIAISSDATVQLSEGKPARPPIAVLGRLAQGSLVGVDAILECFGQRQDRWASGVLRRLDNVDSMAQMS